MMQTSVARLPAALPDRLGRVGLGFIVLLSFCSEL